MPMVKTMSNFCYLECDERNCNKKVEHTNEQDLKTLAELIGWKKNHTHWFCPKCNTSHKANEKRRIHVPKKVRSRAQNLSARSL